MWFPKDNLRDSSSWSSPPLLLLRDIHCKILTEYDYKEVCDPSQYDVSQLQGAAPLSLPQINRLFEVSFVRDENSDSNVDVSDIPSHHKVTQQILSNWQSFLDLKLVFAGSRRAEQLNLRSR